MRSTSASETISQSSENTLPGSALDANSRRLPVSIVLLLVFVMGTLAVIIGGITTKGDAGYKISIAVVWGFGFCVSGMLLGFLFAIPRILPAGAVVAPPSKLDEVSDPAAKASTQATVVGPSVGGQSEINSNLVEVSDWLTKIIVGVGLVELKHLPKAAQDLASFVAPTVGGIMLFFSVHGFLIGYLLTRLYLSMLLKWADNQVISQIPVLQLPSGTRIGAVAMLSQLRNVVDDLQKKVVTLVSAAPKAEPATSAPVSVPPAPPPRILWVDDMPSNNALLVDLLKDANVVIEQVLATNDAMRRLTASPGMYDLVITDMGRKEGNVEVPNAGVILIEKIRSLAADLPVLVYCSRYKKQMFGTAAENAGARLITTSSTDLLGEVKKILEESGRAPPAS